MAVVTPLVSKVASLVKTGISQAGAGGGGWAAFLLLTEEGQPILTEEGQTISIEGVA